MKNLLLIIFVLVSSCLWAQGPVSPINAATAVQLSAAPTTCTYGYATGIDSHGNAICPATSADSDMLFVPQAIPATGIPTGSVAVFVNSATGAVDCIKDDYTTHCGLTISGSACTITEITNGAITGATCAP